MEKLLNISNWPRPSSLLTHNEYLFYARPCSERFMFIREMLFIIPTSFVVVVVFYGELISIAQNFTMLKCTIPWYLAYS